MSANVFFEVYERKLVEAMRRNQEHYAYDPDQVPVVIGKMRTAWAGGYADKDGPATRAACKELGIKHTYTAIRAFLANGGDDGENQEAHSDHTRA